MNEEKPIKTANKLSLFLFLFLLVLLITGGAIYYFKPVWFENLIPRNIEINNLLPTPVSQEITVDEYSDALGLTTISYQKVESEVYIKINTEIYDPIVGFPNSTQKEISKVFTQAMDNSFEPAISENMELPDNWITLVDIPVYNPTDSKSILVTDSLFSLKKAPNSDNFIYVVQVARNGSESITGPWQPLQYQNRLYFYDAESEPEKNKQVATFDKYLPYSYPKIESYNDDGRFVKMLLFACWACGGHTPETYLVDTKTLNTKNIGRVSYFKWNEGGNYEYKDYIVTECTGDILIGECSQDPEELPLNTGSM